MLQFQINEFFKMYDSDQEEVYENENNRLFYSMVYLLSQRTDTPRFLKSFVNFDLLKLKDNSN